jgi:cell fate regulator YaaT (PSP1 superfamily)
MKKRRVKNESKLQSVIRKAHERDIERLDEVRGKEKQTLIQARAIARSLNLNMKIGDIEYQGDGKKVTIFYTADHRVDFRELIRLYHRDFNVKIEMRQIGARQESARIGGLGNCGRELCCSTWLADFKSVNTAAARYQNLAINQIKLTGMCGRLKCCLNYELDAYVDALEEFPDRAERFKTAEGNALLVKTDVFKRLMFYTYEQNRGKFYALHIDQVWEVLDLIKTGKMPQSLAEIEGMRPKEVVEEEVIDFGNVHNVIELPFEDKKKKKKKRKSGTDLKAELEGSGQRRGSGGGGQNRPQQDRGPRPERPQNQGGQDRGPRPERTERPPQQDRGPRPERPQNMEGQDRGPRPERTERPPQQDRGPRPERPQNMEGQDRGPRPERTERPPQQDRGPRPERPQNTEGQEPRAPRPPREGGGNNSGDRNKNRNQGDRPDQGPPAESFVFEGLKI